MGCADLGRPLCYLRWLIRARDRARAWRDVDMTEEEKRGPSRLIDQGQVPGQRADSHPAVLQVHPCTV